MPVGPARLPRVSFSSDISNTDCCGRRKKPVVVEQQQQQQKSPPDQGRDTCCDKERETINLSGINHATDVPFATFVIHVPRAPRLVCRGTRGNVRPYLYSSPAGEPAGGLIKSDFGGVFLVVK